MNARCSPFSLEEKKAQAVVDEIKLAGGDAIAVGGDVSADDFPQKVIDATIKYVLRLCIDVLGALMSYTESTAS